MVLVLLIVCKCHVMNYEFVYYSTCIIDTEISMAVSKDF